MTERSEEWGPWIEHDGSGVPAGVVGLIVEVRAIDNHGTPQSQIGYVDPQRQGHENYRAWDWSFYAKKSVKGNFGYSKIIRYRVRKPRALQQLVDMVESLPAPQPDQVNA